MSSISPKQTVRIKTAETYLEVPLLAFYPDWEPTLKGFAVISNTGQITADGTSIQVDESGRYLQVEELKLHLEDRRALMVYSLKVLECCPIILDETWKVIGIF